MENSTVIRPQTPMARPLIAPSVSPISMALEVPTAWVLVPMASPAATGFLTRNSRINRGEAILPSVPVMETATTVREGIPP